MTDSDLDELARLAKAATPGPWKRSPHCVWAGDSEPGHNAAYIAAANPTTVLALVKELRARRIDVENLLPEADSARFYADNMQIALQRAAKAEEELRQALELLGRALVACEDVAAHWHALEGQTTLTTAECPGCAAEGASETTLGAIRAFLSSRGEKEQA